MIMPYKKFAILLTALWVVSSAQAQVRHYSRDEVPSLEELREVLARPALHSPPHSRARSKAWIQDGQDDERQEVALGNSGRAMPNRPPEIVATRKQYSPSTLTSGQQKGEISIEIVFKLNSDELEVRYANALRNVAQILVETSQPILIEGHTDASGSPEFNASLSTRRANSVKAFLVSKGVASALISTRGVGASKPLDQENPYSSINRRVVFSIL